MKIAVIGGSGLLGSIISRELLAMGRECVNLDLIPDRRGDAVPFRRVDVTEPMTLMAALRDARPDRVIHLAAYLGQVSQANPYAAYRLNIMGSANVLEASRQLGIERVVFASSCSVYGNLEGTSLPEDAPRRPTSVYGMTKLAIEELGKTYMAQYGVQFVAMRPAQVYGAGMMTGYRRPSELILAALRGEEIHLHGGARSLEPIYVADVARAFVAAATVPKLTHFAFNVGIGRRVTLLEVAGILERSLPQARFRIEPDIDISGGDSTWTDQPPMDISAGAEELNWRPLYPPEQGYVRLIDDLRAFDEP